MFADYISTIACKEAFRIVLKTHVVVVVTLINWTDSIQKMNIKSRRILPVYNALKTLGLGLYRYNISHSLGSCEKTPSLILSQYYHGIKP